MADFVLARKSRNIATNAVHVFLNILLGVANLPYVDENWDWLDKKSLAQEPAIALYAKDHGLALIKELIDQAAALRIPRLILEADPCQHTAITHYAATKNYALYNTRGFILDIEYRITKP